jgi:class 3 adenylate cyclase
MPEERKLVTILFADVTGSTALGEALDPEDVRALMARYYQHARRVIADHGGTLAKFIGDAVMAVFGLPQAHGNDAARMRIVLAQRTGDRAQLDRARGAGTAGRPAVPAQAGGGTRLIQDLRAHDHLPR